MTPGSSVRRAGLLAGPAALRSAFDLLRTRRELWPWCVLPMLLNVGLFAVALGIFFGYVLDPLSVELRAYLDVGAPSSWYAWLWIGPLRALGWALRWVLIGLAAVAVYMTFAVVGGVLAAPFLEALSVRVERMRVGHAAELSEPLVRAGWRALREAAKRAGYVAVLYLGVFLVGLIPGFQPLASIAFVAISAGFLALDYTSFALDRRGVTFREKRRWLWQNRTALLGFGTVGLLTLLVPGLNFVCLPWLVTAGTLLATDLEGFPARR